MLAFILGDISEFQCHDRVQGRKRSSLNQFLCDQGIVLNEKDPEQNGLVCSEETGYFGIV